jgi:magnesium chelatase subunit I
VDARSGVSARFAIASTETVAASAVRRAAITGEEVAVARVGDLVSVVPASRGKVEFDATEEGREEEILEHWLRRAIAATFRSRLAGVDLSGLQDRFDEGLSVTTGDLVPARELLRQVGTVPGLARILDRLGDGGSETPELAAAAVEFVLEGLYLNRRLAKDELDGKVVYGQ